MRDNDGWLGRPILLEWFLAERDVAQFGSALGSGPRGRWFESSRPDQKTQVRGLRPLAFFLFWPQEGHRWPQDLLPNCADDTNFESQFMSCAPRA